MWWKKRWEKVLFLCILGIFFLLSPGANIYTAVRSFGAPKLHFLPFPAPTPAPYPVNKTGIYPGSEVSASGIVILDVSSSVYLYMRNESISFAPASTTKLMTALVALDGYELDDILTVRSVRSDGQDMGLVPGERVTVENLLYGLLIQSGNDAAYVLADNYPGGDAKFIEKMNAKGKDLSLLETSFTNPAGYDDALHKTTPKDLANLAKIALSNKTIAKMVAIPQITISDITHTYFHSLVNVNELLGKVPGVGGIKTGWTEEAGENLVTLIDRGGHPVIIVLLHSKDRFKETKKLIDWVYGNYEWQNLEPK